MEYIYISNHIILNWVMDQGKKNIKGGHRESNIDQ